jgi:hypothetical protein
MDPVGPITDLFRTINYIEAGFWTVLGIGFAVRGATSGDRVARRICVTAAATLFAFGASDVVEAGTGAWWHPWWLLVWKGACVVVLAGLMVSWWRSRPRAG